MTTPLTFHPPGTPVDLENCAREPIHVPGRIQSHGVLLVIRDRDQVVVQVSENVGDLFTDGPEGLLGLTLDELLDGRWSWPGDALTAGPGRAGRRLQRLTLTSGRAVDATVFAPAEGLTAFEFETRDDAAEDVISMTDRVSRWVATTDVQGSVLQLLTVAVATVRELTGFDRVWAYRFESDGHGVVVAEHRRGDLDPFLGLHFPESDIPRQARELYTRNTLRLIPDAESEPSPLVPLVNPETGEWLDLSDSGLRAVSPAHILYLRNLGVRASMSIALVVDGRLWGLLSAHHYAGPRQVPLAVRAECGLLGAVCSLQVSAKSGLDRGHRRLEVERAVARAFAAVEGAGTIVGGLVVAPAELLRICDASGVIIQVGGERHLIGVLPAEADIDRLLVWLAETTDDVVEVDALGAVHPSLAGLAERVSGVLAFPLSRTQGNWLVWVRPEVVREVTWGNRDKALVRNAPGKGQLGEHASFERWSEEVRGRSRPWDPVEVEAVRGMRASLGTFLIARADELARLNAELTGSNIELESFAYAAAHDLAEPLRGIRQFTGFLVEDYDDVLDDVAHGYIATVQRLAERMEHLMAVLLEWAQIDQSHVNPEEIDLPSVVNEVRELLNGRYAGDADEITVDPGVVRGDRTSMQNVLLNLILNAIKYSDGPPRIHVGSCALSAIRDSVGLVPRSLKSELDPSVVYVRDHGIGIPARHHEDIFKLFRRLHGREEYGGGSGAGLALCRRIITRNGGAIWLTSAPGEGSTFYFTLERG
jgi:chemotaxis family two-component system sensor kinase Cph1